MDMGTMGLVDVTEEVHTWTKLGQPSAKGLASRLESAQDLVKNF